MEFGTYDILSLIFLILIFFFIKLIELKGFNFNNYTPVTLLIFPIIILLCLLIFTSNFTNFILPNRKVINLFIYGMISFWFGGVIISLFFLPSRKYEVKRISTAPIGFMYVTGVLFSIILLISLKSLLNGSSILNLNKTDFASNGIEAHIGGVIMGYLMFFIIVFWEKDIRKNKILLYVLIIIIFFLKIVSGVRGNIILPLLGAIIYLFVNNYIKLKLKSLLTIATIVILLFMLPTLIFVKDTSANYLVSYFVFYLSAGVLGLSGYMQQANPVIGSNPDFIFVFFINLYKKISGEQDYLSLISAEFFKSTKNDNEYYFFSNVYTLVGEIYVNAGYEIASIFLFLFGAYCYLLYFLKDRSVMLGLLYSFVGASLVLGIFSQYIFSPYFYELQLLFIVLHFFSKYKLKF